MTVITVEYLAANFNNYVQFVHVTNTRTLHYDNGNRNIK